MGSVGTELNADDENVADRQSRTAQYIEDMTSELSVMARRCDLPVLSYLLDLAKIEAGVSAHRLVIDTSRPDIRKRG